MWQRGRPYQLLGLGASTLYAAIVYEGSSPPVDPDGPGEAERSGPLRLKRRLPTLRRRADCFFFSRQRQDTSVQQAIDGRKLDDFHASYKLGKELGSGAYATVHDCEDRSTGELLAVKVFKKKKITQQTADGIIQEMEIMQLLSHPNIVKVFGTYEDKDRYFLVMERCGGGELFDRIVQKTTYNEKEARDLIRILLDAVAYCHQHKVVHRDLKPENLLLVSRETDTEIKITDFGIASRILEPNSLNKNCGTPGYTAPEILQGKLYGPEVDYWSVGVIAYILLGGYPPFGEEDSETIKAKVVFHSPAWDRVSDDAKDLIKKLLVKDPRKRITAASALAHPWIRTSDEELRRRDLAQAKTQLEKFNARRKFKAAVKAVMVTNRMKGLSSGLSSEKKAEPKAES